MLSQTGITSRGSFEKGGGGKAEALRRGRGEWRRRSWPGWRGRGRCEWGGEWKTRQQEDIAIQPSAGQLHLLPLRVLVVLLLLLRHAVCRPHWKHLGSGCVTVNFLQLLPELVQVDLARGRDLARQPRPQKLPWLPLWCPPKLLVSFQAHIDLVWCSSELFSTRFGLFVHLVGRQALPDLDAGARLPGWEWRPKEASAGRACALPMAGTRGSTERGGERGEGGWLSPLFCDEIWGQLRQVGVATGACGCWSQQTWHLTSRVTKLVTRSREDI